MVKSPSDYSNDLENLSEAQQERAMQADEIYRKICEEIGIQVCSWQSFDAWQDYVDDKIGEAQLTEKAREEVNQFPRTFAKYLIVEKEDDRRKEEETKKKERAKSANKIYKKACTDTGLTTCFFNNFSTWTEYVKGNIDESEFYDKAKAEVQKMLASEKEPTG